MTTRALIVAIEEYPDSEVTSKRLPGTIANAERFATWLEKEMQVPRAQIIFCASGNSDYATHGATRSDIKKAVLDLLKTGRDRTGTLFVYLTGHGLGKERPDFEEDSDVLLCSNFVSDALSGDDGCIPLGELTILLAERLGPGDHFWFVDMCRSQNQTVVPAPLAVSLPRSDVGTAKWFQLFSTESGQAAATDSRFIDALDKSLGGDCDLVEEEQAGSYSVTFHNVARAVARELATQGRKIAPRTNGTSDRICSVRRAKRVDTIVGPELSKVPPIRLLCLYDQAIFLGETNSQLPRFMAEAYKDRDSRPWKRIEILTLEDLSTAFRENVSLSDLEKEREEAETWFRDEATSMCGELFAYRYDYVGTYGSMWTAADGARRSHASAGFKGQDIRRTLGSDFVDFPGMEHPHVDNLFKLAHDAISGARRVLSHPQPR